MLEEKNWKKNGYVMRLARFEDAMTYYHQNFNPLDAEVARLTGSKSVFAKEEVVSFFEKAVLEKDRYWFLLIAPDGKIIGESVINEIDWDTRSANFRIAIFQATERDKGIGTWMVEVTRDFAFEELKLHRLALEVYSFNPRAVKVYNKAGFQCEGILRDAILDGNQYADVVLMAMLEEDWKKIKGING